MRSEEEIRGKILRIKAAIYDDVVSGLYTDKLLQEHRDWIECLDWVLQENKDER